MLNKEVQEELALKATLISGPTNDQVFGFGLLCHLAYHEAATPAVRAQMLLAIENLMTLI